MSSLAWGKIIAVKLDNFIYMRHSFFWSSLTFLKKTSAFWVHWQAISYVQLNVCYLMYWSKGINLETISLSTVI